MSALEIHQFPCLSDNYGYLVHDPLSGETAVIDTPDADRILSEAKSKGWTITQIWNTHWHPDHTGGNLKIKDETGCVIIGPAGEEEKIPGLDRAVTEGSLVNLGTHAARVLDLPGHTLGHCAYSMEDDGLAFVGDTLFALGCGRLFEGSAEQMWNSLSKLKALPEDTTIYCAHEYTAANAKFSVTIEPENEDLAAYSERVIELRSQNKPTVPTTLSAELAANPFLRADVPELQNAMGHSGDAVATFAEIRKRKDSF
ncbi:hydroxyacylglutathione hydrolase [Ponticaulis sp.]|uniref:hydroxyacylglutathione hydrolase n=1 Tax=Ponticaulis sp. TaxID=2020902 RepID=UPI00262299DF|nr:hydroxyacylglutathione hydrolase [Ponticaulis sp.]MDF1680142.1 hydroxyacylglutathione hydrolase [Ponticaulis sp.]